MRSTAVVVILKPKPPDEDTTLTEGEKIEEPSFVDPLELVIVVNLSICCLLKGSKAIEPLCEDTVRLRASTLLHRRPRWSSSYWTRRPPSNLKATPRQCAVRRSLTVMFQGARLNATSEP